MNILGISAFYHDSAACIVVNGKIVAAAQEERFTRKKHDARFPVDSTRFCLEYAGVEIDELDALVFYDKPLLKFERLLETYYGFAPKGLQSFMMSMPVWLKEKMFLKRLIKEELSKVSSYDKRKLKMLFPEHHLSHAASAYYPSPFKEAAVLTIDGVGEWATASICHGKAKDMSILKELKFPHSLGLLYSAFTYYLGFKVNSGEYKLMGLAPYGNPDGENVKRFKKMILENLVDVKNDGSIWLNQAYFNYATGLRMTNDDQWEKLFGFKVREGEANLEQIHCDLALAIQQVTEDVVIKMAQEAKRLTTSDNLCMAGGVALNCVANGKLQRTGIFKNIFIQPAAGDAGGALGAALAAYHIHYGKDREPSGAMDEMQGSYLGPENSDTEIEQMARKYKATYTRYEDFEVLTKELANVLADGNVVGWHQGRLEFGPRALGARSILGDPRNDEMQKKLNLKIKYRESFRPFAPSVLAEDCAQHFQINTISPYMLIVAEVLKEKQAQLPANYNDLTLMERLYTKRSDVQAITHLDFSARIQTVHKETNPKYHKLLAKFKEKTGYGMLVNTSFNVRGEPIVCTPEDSYRCFMRTEMDYLVINNYLFSKKEQPEFKDKGDWRKEFALD
jgi:carbamoyltransferase